MIDRRRFLLGAAAGVAWTAAWPASLRAAEPQAARRDSAVRAPLSADLVAKLEKSGFVYVSPLKRDGKESTCHAEVWYAWIDGAVVMTVATDRWKSRAIDRGLDRARIWVGDHGRWKGMLFNNEGFRGAPSFEARGERLWDEALNERLLEAYVGKYPDEIAQWRDRMRKGHADRSRVLVRYTPAG